jgi:copper(I)-binding protein
MRTMQTKTILTTLMAAAVLTLAAHLAAQGAAHAAEPAPAAHPSTMVIDNAWSRATPGGATVGAGYFTVTNKGSVPDRLIGVTSAVADHAEVHEMVMKDGVMMMRPLANGIEIKPGETVQLKPGGNHVMMFGLKQPLKAGEKVRGTLTFEKAGILDIEYAVQGIGGPPPRATGGNMMQAPGGGAMQMH